MTEEKSIQDLLSAIQRGSDEEAINILSDHPELTDVRWTDDWAQEVTTPLIEACRQDVTNVVDFLLANGADVSATGITHFSYKPGFDDVDITNGPFFWVGYGGSDDVFALYITAALSPFSQKNQNKIIKGLLSAGADVNQRTAIGQTALHIACALGYDGHLYVGGPIDTLCLDDNNAAYSSPETEPVRTLIDHGADVNIRDDHGKTPLHYAAESGNTYFVQILLRSGANVYQKDNKGLTVLEYANPDDLLTMALIEKYDFSMKQTINAYERSAMRGLYDVELFRKAILLREVHRIPKEVLEPLECYGFAKEWETIDELESHGDNEFLFKLTCLLATERISSEYHQDITLRSQFKEIWNIMEDQKGINTKYHYNSLFRHCLDRFIYFGNYLYFFYKMIVGNPSMVTCVDKHAYLSNDVLVKFVHVAIDSCCCIQNRLNTERKQGCLQELIFAMEQAMLAIGGVILHLIRRSDGCLYQEHNEGYNQEIPSTVNHQIAKILLNELLHRCSRVSASFSGYFSPVINILFKGKYKQIFFYRLAYKCPYYNYQFMKLIIEAQCDLNAIDYQGNTILHILLSNVIKDINLMVMRIDQRNFSNFAILKRAQDRVIKQKMNELLSIVQLLLDNGSYPHAWNNQGKCPLDVLQDANSKELKFNPEAVIVLFKDLLAKYDYTLTLKYITAKKIVSLKIPYSSVLPKGLVKFVHLH